MRRWRRRRMYVDDLPETHDARFLGLFLLGFFAALAAVYALGYVVAGDKVPAGTTVADVKIGGMSRAEATTALHRQAAQMLSRPLTAEAAGHQVRFTPAEAGVTLDVDATLDDAMDGTDWNPRHMLKVIEGGGHVDPVFRVNGARLATLLAPLAAKVEAAPVSAQVSILAGRVAVQPGQPGRRLDVQGAGNLLTTALSDGRSVVMLRVRSEPPTVDFAAAAAFANQTVRPALRTPVVVTVAGQPLRVTRAQYSPALRITRTSDGYHLGISAAVLYSHTSGVLRTLPGRPVDARIVFVYDRPTVVASRPGRTVDKASWAAAVLAAIGSADRKASARPTVVAARFSTSDARALHITAQLGTASATARARLSSALQLAAGNLDDTVVLPGAEFRYTQAVGQASVSTLLSPLGSVTASAAERAGMSIIQRPSGTSFGGDLVFRNSSDFPIYIHATASSPSGGRLTVFVGFWGSGH